MTFKNQTNKVCPLCGDPIFDDGSNTAEFKSAPGIVMHESCLEVTGAEQAFAKVVGIIENDPQYER